ncbi:MAG: fluoride efflux transporter CrcB [Deltaproteobacteria bacterium]|nr:fluoride efflux transporter CrcB [Deltaproteobacteria bacterium]
MPNLVWICLGGAVGSGARYLVGIWAANTLGTAFPYGTLVVNIAGSFLISVVMALGIDLGAIPPSVRLFLATGVLGGFTTYSSFNYETIKLAQSGAWGIAAINLFGTWLACAVAGFTGLALVGRMAGLGR